MRGTTAIHSLHLRFRATEGGGDLLSRGVTYSASSLHDLPATLLLLPVPANTRQDNNSTCKVDDWMPCQASAVECADGLLAPERCNYFIYLPDRHPMCLIWIIRVTEYPNLHTRQGGGAGLLLSCSAFLSRDGNGKCDLESDANFFRIFMALLLAVALTYPKVSGVPFPLLLKISFPAQLWLISGNKIYILLLKSIILSKCRLAAKDAFLFLPDAR